MMSWKLRFLMYAFAATLVWGWTSFAGSPQTGPARSNANEIITVRAVSGSLGAGETAAAVSTRSYAEATLQLALSTLTLPGADDELDVFFQTTYDGTTWCDLEMKHFANADDGTTPTLIFVFGPVDVLATDKGVACGDAALGDDVKLKLNIGSALRIQTVDTDPTGDDIAFNYSVIGFFRR